MEKKAKKEFEDYIRLGLACLVEGYLTEAQKNLQEASAIPNPSLGPSIIAVSSNILKAYNLLNKASPSTNIAQKAEAGAH